MHARATNTYRAVDLQSAPKSDIMLRLFYRFAGDCSQARKAMMAHDIKTKGAALDHAMAIVNELQASLNHEAAPELCKHLENVYRFVTSRLLTASVKMDIKMLDEASNMMAGIAETMAQAQGK
ncbi:MAG TPA: flagellar export chaperone FliS [Kofleriaceae bacterium]|jgi:flagellar protein FliS